MTPHNKTFIDHLASLKDDAIVYMYTRVEADGIVEDADRTEAYLSKTEVKTVPVTDDQWNKIVNDFDYGQSDSYEEFESIVLETCRPEFNTRADGCGLSGCHPDNNWISDAS